MSPERETWPVQIPSTSRLVSMDARYTYPPSANDMDLASPAGGEVITHLWMTVPRKRLGWLRHIGLQRWAYRTIELMPGDTISEGDSLTAQIDSDGTLRL